MVSPPWMMCCCCCFAGGADDCSSSKSKWKSLWWLFISRCNVLGLFFLFFCVVLCCVVSRLFCDAVLRNEMETERSLREEAYDRNCVLCEDGSRSLRICLIRLPHATSQHRNIAAFLPKVTYAPNDRVFGKIALRACRATGAIVGRVRRVVVRRAILKVRDATTQASFLAKIELFARPTWRAHKILLSSTSSSTVRVE